MQKMFLKVQADFEFVKYLVVRRFEMLKDSDEVDLEKTYVFYGHYDQF
jgi:hypothetical protein